MASPAFSLTDSILCDTIKMQICPPPFAVTTAGAEGKPPLLRQAFQTMEWSSWLHVTVAVLLLSDSQPPLKGEVAALLPEGFSCIRLDGLRTCDTVKSAGG